MATGDPFLTNDEKTQMQRMYVKWNENLKPDSIVGNFYEKGFINDKERQEYYNKGTVYDKSIFLYDKCTRLTYSNINEVRTILEDSGDEGHLVLAKMLPNRNQRNSSPVRDTQLRSESPSPNTLHSASTERRQEVQYQFRPHNSNLLDAANDQQDLQPSEKSNEQRNRDPLCHAAASTDHLAEGRRGSPSVSRRQIQRVVDEDVPGPSESPTQAELSGQPGPSGDCGRGLSKGLTDTGDCGRGLSKGLTEWMTNWLKPDAPLCSISIPGTHDSMTYESPEVWSSWSSTTVDSFVMCQERSISDQLNAGIRFLDIRLKKSDGEVIFSHGPVKLNVVKNHFTSVVSKFLEDHPKEFLIMRIKDEKESAKDLGEILFNERDDNFFKEVHHLIWKKELSESTTVTVSDVQGKIVLLREYEDTAKSLNDYNYGCSFKGFPQIADMWDLKIPLTWPGMWIKSWFTEHPLYHEKFTKVKENFEKSNGQKLCISFLSGTNTSGPRQVAQSMNEKMLTHLEDYQWLHREPQFCGIVVMDFPRLSLIKEIINVNR